MKDHVKASSDASLMAIVMFYNFAMGKQARLAFSEELRHCNVITYDGEHYVLTEFDLTGIWTRVINAQKMSRLFEGLKTQKNLTAMFVIQVNKRARVMWKPLWGRTCNELVRYSTGIDVGLTFNPRHLYSKLLKYDKIRNYEILQQWRR